MQEEQEVGKVSYALVLGTGKVYEFTCDKDGFPLEKRDMLQSKELVGYIREDKHNSSVKYFLKVCGNNVFDFYRIKEQRYYESYRWSFVKVSEEAFSMYLRYIGIIDLTSNPGAKKYLLKQISQML